MFDAKGRPIHGDEQTAGRQTSHYEITYDDDERSELHQTWFEESEGEALKNLTTTYRDASGLIERIEDADGTTGTYTWATDWSCPGLIVETRGQRLWTKEEPVCDEAGRLSSFRQTDVHSGESFVRRKYTWENGRVASVTDYALQGPPGVFPYVRHLKYDSRGAVAQIEIDFGADGTLDFVDAFDLSCWRVESDRIRYVAP